MGKIKDAASSPEEGQGAAIDGNSLDDALESQQQGQTGQVIEEAAAAGTPTAEDTASLDSFKRLAESQAATINELTERIITMQTEMARLVSSGAQISDGGKTEPPRAADAPEYVPLSELDLTL